MKLEKINLRNKKAQGIFGLSFGMIWSIILIVFFIISAFIGIRAFLNYQKNATIGLFMDGLQSRINEAWNSQSIQNFRYNSTLPGGVEYVCFINLSATTPKNASNIEKSIFEDITSGAVDYSKNFYIYAPGKDYSIKWANIKHVDLSQKNPICIQVLSGGKVSIKMERNFEDPLVSVSA
jgi:hypothetical protein